MLGSIEYVLEHMFLVGFSVARMGLMHPFGGPWYRSRIVNFEILEII